MKRLTIGAAIGVFLLASAVGATVSPTKYFGHVHSKNAKLTLKQARIAALKARPGRIVAQELEREKGGSGLRYSFDIMSHGKVIEVGIDAITGAVLENGAESAASEAKEASKEPKR